MLAFCICVLQQSPLLKAFDRCPGVRTCIFSERFFFVILGQVVQSGPGIRPSAYRTDGFALYPGYGMLHIEGHSIGLAYLLSYHLMYAWP